MVSAATVHLLCAACAAVAVAARVLRLWVLLRAAGWPVGMAEALRANLLGELAGTLTPMRLGGTPLRALVLRRRGIPLPASLGVTLLESMLEYPLAIAVALALMVRFAPSWWRAVGSRMSLAAADAAPWLALAVALAAVGWAAARHWLPARRAAGQVMASTRELMAMSPAAICTGALLTALDIGARLALLPLLTLALPRPPPVGVTALSSMALLYGQLVFPTPAGAGAVELGFLAGAAGVHGSAAAHLLVAWRVYTAMSSIGLGLLAMASGAARLLPAAYSPRLKGGEA